MNTSNFNGITELSELTEFFMKEKAAEKIVGGPSTEPKQVRLAQDARFFKAGNAAVTVFRRRLRKTNLKCSHSVNSENSVIPSKQQFYI